MLTMGETDPKQIEDYLLHTFSKVTDLYNHKLDITPALPTLLDICSGRIQLYEQKKFDFIGEAACQFAIHSIIASAYPELENNVLTALAKKFRNPQKLLKEVIGDIKFQKYKKSENGGKDIEIIMGVLYSFFGMQAIERFIQVQVLRLIDIDLGNISAPSKKAPGSEAPLYELNLKIAERGGSIEFRENQAESQRWQVEVVAKFQPTSMPFYHSRTAGSKHIAKKDACRDILELFSKRPDMFEQFNALYLNLPENTVPQILPITTDDYTQTPRPNRETSEKEQSPNSVHSVHIASTGYEEAMLKLQQILLADKEDNNNDDFVFDPLYRKRMREYNPDDNNSTQSINTPPRKSSSSGSLSQARTPSIKLESEVITPTSEPEFDGIVKNPMTDTMYQPILSDEPSRMEFNTTNQALHPAFKIHDTPSLNMESGLASESPAIAELNSKCAKYFISVFAKHRKLLAYTLEMPGQAKTVFLSLAVEQKEKVTVETKSDQIAGSSHDPIFHAKVALISNENPNILIQTEGIGKRKKDSINSAFLKIIKLLKP